MSVSGVAGGPYQELQGGEELGSNGESQSSSPSTDGLYVFEIRYEWIWKKKLFYTKISSSNRTYNTRIRTSTSAHVPTQLSKFPIALRNIHNLRESFKEIYFTPLL